jgi:elongation factor G
VDWKGTHINIIDTPGHVDFTIEVERALRVLDGAILVLCSVGGVQSQTITVDRQLKRYNVPRVAFVNKCDRTGANPYKVKDQLREKLGHNAVMIEVPIGLEEKLEGVVDLVKMKAIYFEGADGLDVVEKDIPAELQAEADEKREELLDAASMFDDDLAEKFLEGEDLPVELIQSAIRKGVIAQELTPVFLGSAYKNKGVQPLLDGVISYLPNPTDVDNFAVDLEKRRRRSQKLKYPTMSLPSPWPSNWKTDSTVS